MKVSSAAACAAASPPCRAGELGAGVVARAATGAGVDDLAGGSLFGSGDGVVFCSPVMPTA